MSLRFYFSKQQFLYANSYNDTMLAYGTLIHECTPEQMISSKPHAASLLSHNQSIQDGFVYTSRPAFLKVRH